MPISEVHNCDCLEYMKTLPDNYFDLMIADAPYGDGLHAEDGGGKGWFTKYNQRAPESDYNKARSQSVHVERERENQEPYNRFGNPGSKFEKYKREGADGKKIIAWDVAPSEDYFKEMFRVSRNQIIWGGNYFQLPPTRCFIVWKKLTISENFSMAMAEYAWTSFNSNAKVFEGAPQGKPGDPRWHPTSKPIALYKFCLKHFAKPGDKIFDPYLGSGSSRIAAWDMGYDFVGCEIDKVYFDLMEKRFEQHTKQTRMDL